MQWYSFLLLIP